MEQNDRYIPGVPCWVDTTQPDPQAAVSFYSGLFGWEFDEVQPGSYWIARLPGGSVGAVGSQLEEGATQAAWNTYVWVEDAEATAAKVRDAGGTVLVEPAEVGDAGRMAVFADPDGAAFSVWQAKENRGAAVVNEPGSVNFNDLSTRDLDRAKEFYGAVFGWDVLGYGDGGMWALAGYGDFLESRTPGMRENMAQMGAPERFEDVVASVRPAGDAPAHWSLTFAVDDADAIASRAAELGATVLAEPVDAPWSRVTVIRDPQGATFTASKFVPENKDLPA
jgi:predicted enzyme related to lactoylglutathione lyase